jgi:HD-GYP domain-containing protein (c-di-GMP phosphodiesterase class II)
VTTKTSWHLFGGHSREDAVTRNRDAWDLLDDFLNRLQERQEVSRQMRLVLEMVHQATPADVAFLCAADPTAPVEFIGTPHLGSEWCRAVVRTLLEQTPGVEGQLLCAACAGGGLGLPEPAPASAALVRLSKSRCLWIAAVSFDSARRFRHSDINLMRLARRLLTQQNRFTQTFGHLRDTLFGLVRSLTAALDARDPYTWGHSERVARMAVRLAREMGLSEAEVNDLYLGGLLHDIGKIGIRDAVLSKPGALTPEERAVIQRHPVIGDALLSHVSYFATLRPSARSHHEHFDGSGYPDGLAGEAIPRAARIIAVADALDAMLSERPYRQGMPPARVEEVLRQGAGRQWDPDIIDRFFPCRQELYAIHQRGLGESVVRAVEQAIAGSDPHRVTPPSICRGN